VTKFSRRSTPASTAPLSRIVVCRIRNTEWTLDVHHSGFASAGVEVSSKESSRSQHFRVLKDCSGASLSLSY
jgi:hypothetical protein